MPKNNLERRSSTPDVDIHNVDTAFDPEARQAQQDWLDYLKQRPYQDAHGNIHDPKTGRFMSVDTTPDENQAYYDKIARETLSNTSRENAGLLTLAKLAREARERGDKTMLGDLSDEINDKLSAAQEQYGWSEETLGQHHDFITNMIYGDESTSEQLEPSTTEPSGGKQPEQPKPSAATQAILEKFEQFRSQAKADSSEQPNLSAELEMLSFSPLRMVDSDEMAQYHASHKKGFRFWLERIGIIPAVNIREMIGYSQSRSQKDSKRWHPEIAPDRENQDSFTFCPETGMLAAFDGVGSGEDSSVMSRAAVEFAKNFSQKHYSKFDKSTISSQVTLMERFFEEAKSKLREVAKEEELDEYNDTTGVLAHYFIEQNTETPMLCVGHIGDSRAYLRRKDGHVVQLTNDQGESNIIFGAMRNHHIMKGPDIVITPLAEGDTVLVVTDGITGDRYPDILSTSDIETQLNKTATRRLSEAILGLMRLSKKRDDTTVVAARFS